MRILNIFDTKLGDKGIFSPKSGTSMASEAKPSESAELKEWMGKLDKTIGEIHTGQAEIKKGQESLRKTVDSKLDILRNELKQDIECKLKAFKGDIDIELGIMTAKHEKLSDEMDSLRKMVAAVTTTTDVTLPEGSYANAVGALSGSNVDPLHDVDKCVIASGVLFQDDENLDDKMARLMDDLPEIDFKPVKSIRLSSRSTRYPPLVKMAFSSLEEKIKVLRAKNALKHSREFARVFLRGSKTHTERLIELNFRKLLDIVPGGEDLRVASNGRIVEKSSDDMQNEDRTQGAESGLGRGRGRQWWGSSYRGHSRGMGNKRRRQATGSPDHIPFCAGGSGIPDESKETC